MKKGSNVNRALAALLLLALNLSAGCSNIRGNPAKSKEGKAYFPMASGLKDRGLFSQFDKKVALRLPIRAIGQGDRDGDKIPDQLDILIGAKKLVLNGARYQGGYLRLKYPKGDVPSNMGVCTDVVIRAMRNAGYDLQKLLYLHIKKNRRSYPEIVRPDKNIDHRRVRNLIIYFKDRFKLISRGITRSNRGLYLPGDIIFMDTLPSAGPDHIGIVSDGKGKNGYPLVINNWTYGHRTAEMELLPEVPVTHHFRIK